MNVRLIAEDDVMEILCKYVQDSKQKTLVWAIISNHTAPRMPGHRRAGLGDLGKQRNRI